MAIKFADEPGHCPDPLSTPDPYMGGFCATNFTFGPESKFCWDHQPDYSAFRETSFGYGILEVPFLSYPTSSMVVRISLYSRNPYTSCYSY